MNYGSIRSLSFALLLIAFALFSSLILGLAAAWLAPSFTVILAMLMLLPLSGAILLALPTVRRLPQKHLLVFFGLCLFLYFVWPKHVFIPVAALPVKHPQKILYLFFLAVWVAYLFKSVEMRRQFTQSFVRNKTIVWLWIGLVAWRFLTVLTSDEPLFSFFRFFDDFLTYYIWFPVVLTLVRSDADVRTVMNWLLAAAIVTSLFVLPEVLIKKNLFLSISTMDMVDPVQAQQITSAKFRGGTYRAQSSFDHPLTFSEFLVTVMPWAAASLLVLRKRRWMMAAALGLIGLALMLTNSRSSIAASMIMGALFLFIAVMRNARSGSRNPWPLAGAIFLLPLAIFVTVLFSGTMQEILAGRTSVEQGSSLARMQMFDQGLPLVLAQPLLGYGQGLGAWKLGFANTFGVITLDNYYLAAALESGIPYVLLFIALALAAVVKCLRTVGDEDPWRAWMYASIGAGLVGFMAVKSVLGTPHNFPIFFVLLGLACVAGLPSNTHKKHEAV